MDKLSFLCRHVLNNIIALANPLLRKLKKNATSLYVRILFTDSPTLHTPPAVWCVFLSSLYKRHWHHLSLTLLLLARVRAVSR